MTDFYTAYVRTLHTNSMGPNARVNFVRKCSNNGNLYNLSIIELSRENVRVAAYYAQSVLTEAKSALP